VEFGCDNFPFSLSWQSGSDDFCAVASDSGRFSVEFTSDPRAAAAAEAVKRDLVRTQPSGFGNLSLSLALPY